jgi:prepilin-type N-terminal cleavage/methylation domain-containing protein
MMRRLEPRGASAPGFTLIELMLAVGVLAMILAMLAGSFGAVARSKSNAEGRMYASWEGRAVVSRLGGELRGAVQTAPVESRVMLVGSGRMERGLPLDNISISTLTPGRRRSVESLGAEQLVTYTTTENPKRRGWFLLVRSQMSGLASATGGIGAAESTVIADNVISLHLRYFDGQVWHESWNSDQAAAGDQLPRAVSIDLKMGASGGRVLDFSTAVSLPMSTEDW